MPDSSAFTSARKSLANASLAINSPSKVGSNAVFSRPPSTVGIPSLAIPTAGKITTKSAPERLNLDGNSIMYERLYSINTNNQWCFTVPPGVTSLRVEFNALYMYNGGRVGAWTVTIPVLPGLVLPIRNNTSTTRFHFGIPNLYEFWASIDPAKVPSSWIESPSRRPNFNEISDSYINPAMSVKNNFSYADGRGYYFRIYVETSAAVGDPQTYLEDGPAFFFPYARIDGDGTQYINDTLSGSILTQRSTSGYLDIPENSGPILAVAIGPGGSGLWVSDYNGDFGGGGGGLSWGIMDPSKYNFTIPYQVSPVLSSGGGEEKSNHKVATVFGKRDSDSQYILAHAGNSSDVSKNDGHPGAGGGFAANKVTVWGGGYGGQGYGPRSNTFGVLSPHRGGGGGAGGYMGDGGKGQQPMYIFPAVNHQPATAGSGGGGGGGGDYSRGRGTGFLFEPNYSGPAGMDGSVFVGATQDAVINTFYKASYGGGGTADWEFWGGNKSPVNGQAGGIFVGWYTPPSPVPLPVNIYVERFGNGLNSLGYATAYPITANGSSRSDNDFFLSVTGGSIVRRAVVTPNPTSSSFDAVTVQLSQIIPLTGSFDGTSDTVAFGLGPLAMWVEDHGNTVYLCDPNNNAIRKMVRDTSSSRPVYTITTLIGGPNNVGRELSDPASTAKFNFPTSIVYGSKMNRFLVIDDQGQDIRLIDINGKVTTIVCPAIPNAVLPDNYSTGDGVAFHVFFNNALYYYDSRNTPPNDIRFRVGNPGVPGHVNGTNGALFNTPTCMVFDPARNIIVGETSPYIRKVEPNGTVSDLCVIPSTFYNPVGGFSIAGLAYDSMGILYITIKNDNFFSHVIYKYDGYSVTYFSGLFAGAGYQDGVVTGARYRYPTGLHYDRAYNIMYVADSGNNVIRYINMADSRVYTLSGVSGQAGYVNSNYGAPTFSKPTSLTMDSSGNLYVCDNQNHGIRKIKPML